MRLAARVVLWVVAAFYAYGALVHVMNMVGLSGFDWRVAPLKWQVLDMVYLVLDVVVVVGFVARWRVGYWAFFAAAASQIVLYTAFRAWIIEVPKAFARTPEQIAYLDLLVIFHLVTLGLVALAIRLLRPETPALPTP